MSVDVYFPENIARVTAALSEANRRDMALARSYGANAQLIEAAEAAYQAALADLNAAFGLQRPELLMVLEAKYEQTCSGQGWSSAIDH
jgi:hypothetical protein